MIAVVVNGKRETVGPGTSIGGYLAQKKIDPAIAVVEVNGSIVKREDFDKTVLKGSDTIEVLRFVGGG